MSNKNDVSRKNDVKKVESSWSVSLLKRVAGVVPERTRLALDRQRHGEPKAVCFTNR